MLITFSLLGVFLAACLRTETLRRRLASFSYSWRFFCKSLGMVILGFNWYHFDEITYRHLALLGTSAVVFRRRRSRFFSVLLAGSGLACLTVVALHGPLLLSCSGVVAASLVVDAR
jgi:hypothetical protein